MSKSDTYNIVMPFLDQSNSFTHGFECGQIWQLLGTGKPIVRRLCHTKNQEQIRLMCKRFHYNFLMEKYDHDWSYLTAELDLQKAN